MDGTSRQRDDKRGAFSRAAFDIDAAVVGFDQCMDDGESQAGSLVLGRKKWIENPGLQVRRNADAGVTDGELHSLGFRDG